MIVRDAIIFASLPKTKFNLCVVNGISVCACACVYMCVMSSFEHGINSKSAWWIDFAFGTYRFTLIKDPSEISGVQ